MAHPAARPGTRDATDNCWHRARGYLLLHTSFIQSVLLGAILASTDPIVLRDIVRDERIPRSVRRTLTIEAGTNDIIVLPIVLIGIEVLQAAGGGPGYWVGFLARLLVLSPIVGLAVGGIGGWFMGKADERYSIRQEYQALYGIGLVLASYSAAQALGGDGFLAAFFAGLAVALFDVTLCDCFMAYGEVTAEMAMLLAFILFGAVLGPLFGTISFGIALVFAIIAIFIVRPGRHGAGAMARQNESDRARFHCLVWPTWPLGAAASVAGGRGEGPSGNEPARDNWRGCTRLSACAWGDGDTCLALVWAKDRTGERYHGGRT